MLEEMVKKLEKEEADVCICGFQYTYERKEKNVNYKASKQISYCSTQEYVEQFMAQHIRQSYSITSME